MIRAMPADAKEPSVIEALLVISFALIIELLLIVRHGLFWDATSHWLDNPSYTNITLVLLGRKTSSSLTEHHFWGFPYLTAAVSTTTSASIPFCMSAISIAAALCTCVLIHRLYGGWVATAFAALSVEWLRLSLLGGSEPLFMCLLLASFVGVRSNHWAVAGLIAAAATTVRPVGAIALVSMAGVLVTQRKWKTLGVLTALAAGVACLYFIPVYLLLGDPLINIERYRSDWGASGVPLSLPFSTMIESYRKMTHEGAWGYWTHFIMWPLIVLASLAFLVFSKARWRLLNEHPVEAAFAALYLAFLVSYAYIGIAWHLPRFIIPLLPMLLFLMRDMLPKSRWIVYSGVALTAVIAGVRW
jgi:hypothetical protein